MRSNNSGHRPRGVLPGDVDGFALTGPFQKLKKHGWVYFLLYALLTDSLFTSDVHTSPSEFVNVSFFHTGTVSTGWKISQTDKSGSRVDSRNDQV